VNGYSEKNFANDLKDLATKSGDCALVKATCIKKQTDFGKSIKTPDTDYKTAQCCEIDSKKTTISVDCPMIYGKKAEIAKAKLDAKCLNAWSLIPVRRNSFHDKLRKVATETGDCGKVKAECGKLQQDLLKTLPTYAKEYKTDQCCKIDKKARTISVDCVIIYGGKEQVKQSTAKSNCNIDWPLPPVRAAPQTMASLIIGMAPAVVIAAARQF